MALLDASWNLDNIFRMVNFVITILYEHKDSGQWKGKLGERYLSKEEFT